MLLIAKRRGQDAWGSGDYLAPRGSRTHNGEDFLCDVGTEVASHVQGVVIKLGYPYADDLSYRYVSVKTTTGFSHRFFYVEPGVKVGDTITLGEVLGRSQDLGKRYNGIPQHYHYEVCTYPNGMKTFHNPNEFLL